MGGSSGGGAPASAAPAVSPTGVPMQTIQPAASGQLDALSQQLAAGYGQTPSDIMSYLNQFYKPMSIPDYSPQAAAAPNVVAQAATAPTPPQAAQVTAPDAQAAIQARAGTGFDPARNYHDYQAINPNGLNGPSLYLPGQYGGGGSGR